MATSSSDSSSGSSSSDEESQILGKMVWQLFIDDLLAGEQPEEAREEVEYAEEFFFGGRQKFPGGKGTLRPGRKKPRLYNPQGANPKERRYRDTTKSVWWQRYFSAPMIEGTLAWEGFRDKFRTPWPMFNWLLDEARRSDLFPDEANPKPGNPPMPLGLKVASCLRYLALGCPVEANEEAASLSRSTMQIFHCRFMEWAVGKWEEEWIRGPQTPEEVAKEEKKFRLCGLPGCIASMDGVHCPWDRSPSQEKYVYVGKEGYPTVAWNVCASHSKVVMHVNDAFGGNKNDKTMVQTDWFVEQMLENPLYKEMEFELLVDTEGNTKRVKGAWILCDGGYHRWIRTMAGWKQDEAPSLMLARCGKRMESIRKDSECTYGIIKKRHRILKVPSLLHRSQDIDNVFRMCCILHNWIMTFDGLDDIGKYEDDYILITDAEMCSFEHNTATHAHLPGDEDLLNDILTNDRRVNWSEAEQATLSRGRLRPVMPHTDMMLIGTGYSREEVATEVEADYMRRREDLALHMHCAFERGELRWLKPACECRPDRSEHGVRGPWCT